MTISQTQLAQELSEPEIKKFWLGYFQESFREAIHQDLLEQYEHLRDTTGLSRSDLAKKIGRRPEQVTRWLSSPTNLEADSISDLGLGMGLIPKISFQPVGSLFVTTKPNQGNAVSDYIKNFSVHMVPQDDANPIYQKVA
jgi:hypothetical protein